jgi:hypothetical protein
VAAVIKLHAAAAAWKWLRSNPCRRVFYTEVNRLPKKHLKGVSEKEQRQYEHIKESAEKSGHYGKRAKEVAARTVMKQHKSKGHKEGEWQTALHPRFDREYQQRLLKRRSK